MKISLGEHSVIIGQNGSGKTMLAKWLMLRNKITWLIMDTKAEGDFRAISGQRFKEWEKLDEVIETANALNRRIICYTPPLSESIDPDLLDSRLLDIHANYRDVGILIDEGYSFMAGTQAGPGLLGVLTRGRAKKQSLMILSQRPSWITRFVFSESKHFFAGRIVDKRDRSTLDSFIPDYSDYAEKLKRYEFLYYHAGENTAEILPAVKLPKNIVSGKAKIEVKIL